ncbi:MAG: choice-of-anchor Q domain-containing protein [Anaerolineae bacterium]
MLTRCSAPSETTAAAHKPFLCSPVARIDAYSSNCPATDQRGIARPQGAACDIGAFELVSIVPTPTPSATTISENEFFAALETARAGYPDVQRIIPDFQTNAINLTVITADGTSGVVAVTITQGQGFTEMSLSSITVSGTSAPASYVTIVNRDLPQILTAALDALVTERFGSLVNVYRITVTSSALQISLNTP